MITNVPHIMHQAFLNQRVCFLSFRHVTEGQTFHGKRFAVFWKFFEDRIGLFYRFLVLLHLVVLDYIFENIRLALWQRPPSSGLWVVRSSGGHAVALFGSNCEQPALSLKMDLKIWLSITSLREMTRQQNI